MATIFTTGDNNFGPAKWIVNPTAGLGTHTTIASALTSASSGDTIFIMPATYTENPTLKAGVNLSSYICDGYTGNVIINGNCTLSTAGTVTISGIELKTNSAACVTVSGSVASILNLVNCNINCLNNSGITFSSSSASSAINLYQCNGNLATTGIAYFIHTANGNITFYNGNYTNSGSSSTASTISSSGIYMYGTKFQSIISQSSTGASFIYNSSVNIGTNGASLIAASGITLSGTTTTFAINSQIGGSSQPAISIGSGCTGNLINCTISSVNTNAVTGAGSLSYSSLTFSGSSTINVTTQSSAGTLQGSTTTAPTTGFLGEQIRSYVNGAGGISVSNATPTNITSINLTAGIWDVSLIMGWSGSPTGNFFEGSINTTSGTRGILADSSSYTAYPPISGGNDNSISLPSYRLTLSTTTTVYMVAFCTISVGTVKAYGRISATRVG